MASVLVSPAGPCDWLTPGLETHSSTTPFTCSEQPGCYHLACAYDNNGSIISKAASRLRHLGAFRSEHALQRIRQSCPNRSCPPPRPAGYHKSRTRDMIEIVGTPVGDMRGTLRYCDPLALAKLSGEAQS